MTGGITRLRESGARGTCGGAVLDIVQRALRRCVSVNGAPLARCAGGARHAGRRNRRLGLTGRLSFYKDARQQACPARTRGRANNETITVRLPC